MGNKHDEKGLHFLVYTLEESNGMSYNNILLDVTVNEADRFMTDTTLLKMFSFFMTALHKEEYEVAIWKEGEYL